MHLWPNYSFEDTYTVTLDGIGNSNAVMIGNCIWSNCGYVDGHVLVKHFSIEEGYKTQAEVEALVVNDPVLTVDCSYYESAFEFVDGVTTEMLGGTLTL